MRLVACGLQLLSWVTPYTAKLISENCAVLGYYTVSSDNPLTMFWDSVLVPSARVKKSKKKRKPARRYTVYMGKGVGGDWYSVSMMTANRVETACGREGVGKQN
jgi:hypothetical protein